MIAVSGRRRRPPLSSLPGMGRTKSPTARPGGAQGHRLDVATSAAPPRSGGHGRGTGGIQEKLDAAVEQVRDEHPDAVVEVFAADERRIGLKPILRRVRAPCGERPVATGPHRFEWLHVTAFVSPATGESHRHLGTGVSGEPFAETLALLARDAGAGPDRAIMLVTDNAGWHTDPGLTVPNGIRLVCLPPYSPEFQPAETPWTHVDGPLANRHFATLADLDAVAADRCVTRANDPERIRRQTAFHWPPKRCLPN